MRIASNTIYDLTVSRLNQNLEDLHDSNTVVTSTKRINNLSDDPVGLSRVISIKSTISNLDQLQRNIASARTMLTAGESTLDSVQDLINDMKTLSIEMNNGIMSESDRESAAQQVEGALEQIEQLANSAVNGQYIFSGNKIDTKPFEFAFDENGERTGITYSGNDVGFTIKTGQDTTIEVGYDGEDIFERSYIVVDDTNNKIDFREKTVDDSMFGAELTASIPSGQYTADELAAKIEAAMEKSSASSVEIVDVNNDNAKVVVNNYDVLTTSGEISLDFQGDDTWSLSTDYTPLPEVIVHQSDASHIDLDFTGNGIIDISIDLENPAQIGENASFTIDLNGGNAVDYDVTYDEESGSFSIQENGDTLEEIELLWESGSNADNTIAHDIGFESDSSGKDKYDSDEDVQWGIFNTLIDFASYLKNNDVAGINRSIARLDVDYEHMINQISDIGAKQLTIDIKENLIEDLNLSYNENVGTIEDADMIKAISELSANEIAYEAALASSARVMQLSLMDYV